jgi:hypothetical protein
MIRRLSALVACLGVAAVLTLLLIGPSAALIFSSGPPATGITGSITSASTGCIQIGELDGDPTITCVTRLIVSNTTLTDTGNGGATLITGAGGGGGTGDVSSNTSVSVDNELALFAGTTGKSIKRATTTGLLKGTAGVLSAAVAGTDYVAPAGNVATATALATNGNNCAPGQAAQGIDTQGNAESCVNLTDTNTTTSVANELVQFADTGGKVLKRATGTGIAYLTNGVLSIAAPGTAYVVPSGNVATATALAANGINCSPGQFATGVDAQGNAEGCTTPAGSGDASTNTSTSVVNEIALFADTNGKILKRATTTGLLKGTAGVVGAAVAGTDYVLPSGNVATATALAGNGSNCAAGQFSTGVDAQGNAEGCAIPPGSGNPAFSALQSGVNNGANMQVGTGASLGPTGSGTVIATTFAVNGTNCGVGQFATGVDASGNAEGCAAPPGVSTGFDAIGSGTNITAAMNVGAGASLQSTGGPIDATKLGGVDASAYAKLNGPQVLTQTQNVPRVVPLTIGVPAANQIQPSCDSTDIATLDAIPADLFVANPVCTGSNPRPEQEIEFRFFSSTPRAITWDSGYCETNGYALLTSTTGDGATFDHIKFRRNALSNCWGVIANTRGVQRGVTQLATSTSTTTAYACNPALAHLCRQQITGASGTITVTMTSAVPDGTLTRLAFRCTNAQSLVMSTANFMPSPNIPIPTQCPAAVAGTGWFEIGVAYSQLDGKHQILATN